MLKKTRLVALTSLGLFLGYCALQANDKNHPNEEKSNTTTSTTTTTHSITHDKKDQIDMKKLSEAFGHFIGRNLQSPGLSFDLEGIIKGIRDGAAGQPAPLNEKEYEEMMTAVQEKAFKEMSASNLKAANEFMEKNSQTNGVKEVIPGKLQYLILKEGTGAAVQPHTSPKIHYTGKYQDGTVFGTSEEMGDPIKVALDQTIPGFAQGIPGMREGEKRRLFVHPDYGYGTTGQLLPNELLIFDVEVFNANAGEGTNKSQGSLNQDEDEDEDFFLDEEDSLPSNNGQHKPATSGSQSQNYRP